MKFSWEISLLQIENYLLLIWMLDIFSSKWPPATLLYGIGTYQSSGKFKTIISWNSLIKCIQMFKRPPRINDIIYLFFFQFHTECLIQQLNASRLFSSCPSLPDLTAAASNGMWPAQQTIGLNSDRRKSWTAIEDLTIECGKNSHKR